MCRNAPGIGMSRIPQPTNLLRNAKNKKLNTANFVTQNVRGLKSCERFEELVHAIQSGNTFAACIQETWRTGAEILELNQCRILLSGLAPDANVSKRGSQGVGIFLSEAAVKAWRSAGSVVHNDLGARVIATRLLVEDIDGREVGLFLVSAYAPVGCADQAQWDLFFDKMDICLSRKRSSDILLLGADTNSSMGCDRAYIGTTNILPTVGKFGIEHVNYSGRRFLSYLAVNDLLALTTFFKKKSYGTWIHPRSKNAHQIDHFITSKNTYHRFLDAGVTQSLIDSDHRAVRCKVRIMHRLKKCSTPRQRMLHLDHSKLNDIEIKNGFCHDVAHQFNGTAEDGTHAYTRLAKCAKSAAIKLLPKKPKANPGWFEAAKDKLTPLIEERNNAIANLYAINTRTRSCTLRLRRARKCLKAEVSKAKNEWIQRQCSQLNESTSGHGGTKQSWEAVTNLKKGLSKVRQSNQQNMMKPDGSLASTPEENAEVFRAHFNQLYHCSPDYDTTVLHLLSQHPVATNCDHMPSDDEIRTAVSKLKNAPGDSGLCPQIWKALIESDETFNIFKNVITDFWDTELVPPEWEIGVLNIIAKKGDLSKPDNYRGIMLLETAYKVVAIILHSRLLPIEEGLGFESQCGFRPQRGCTDAIFTIKMAIKKRREHGLESWVLFIDLVKAFDKVPRQLLWEILAKFGVPSKLISLLRSLHNRVVVKFTVNEVTHHLECIIGVKQGDILGPILFVFYIAAIIITWRKLFDRPLCVFHTRMDFTMTGRNSCTRGDTFPIDDSEYADDTAVLFPTRDSLEQSAPDMILHFKRFGAEIHLGTADKDSKSEVLFVSKPECMYDDPETYDGQQLSNIQLANNTHIPIVDWFCYLGSILARDCRDSLDVANRIKVAGNAFGALRACLFRQRKISLRAKSVVYVGLVLSILLYGSETWCLTERLLHQLRLFHARCARSMCRLNLWHTRKHHISTVHLLQRIGLKSIDYYVTKRQLKWVGHVSRMNYNRLPRKMLSCWVSNKRPRGSPQFTFGRGIQKALKKANIIFADWHILASNRLTWKNILADMDSF